MDTHQHYLTITDEGSKRYSQLIQQHYALLMNPNCTPGIMPQQTTYSMSRMNWPALLMIAMMDRITTRKRGKATPTVTNDSASIPRVSMVPFIMSLLSFSYCSCFVRKYGLSWPPDVDVVTTPCRKSWNFVDGVLGGEANA